MHSKPALLHADGVERSFMTNKKVAGLNFVEMGWGIGERLEGGRGWSFPKGLGKGVVVAPAQNKVCSIDRLLTDAYTRAWVIEFIEANVCMQFYVLAFLRVLGN